MHARGVLAASGGILPRRRRQAMPSAEIAVQGKHQPFC